MLRLILFVSASLIMLSNSLSIEKEQYVWEVDVHLRLPSFSFGMDNRPESRAFANAIAEVASDLLNVEALAVTSSLSVPLRSLPTQASFTLTLGPFQGFCGVAEDAFLKNLDVTVMAMMIGQKLGVEGGDVQMKDWVCVDCARSFDECPSAESTCENIARATICPSSNPKCFSSSIRSLWNSECSYNPSATAKSSSDEMTIQGVITVVIEEFEDGSEDEYAFVTTAEGVEIPVHSPTSRGSGDWRSLRTGDEVIMVVSAEETTGVSRSAPGEGMGMGTDMGMGAGGRRAGQRPRHEFRRLEHAQPKAEDKQATGAHSLIAIRVVYSNYNPDVTCTAACLQGLLWTRAIGSGGNVNDMYLDSSYGLASYPQASGVIVTVSVAKTIGSYDACNKDALSSIGNDADAAATAAGINLSLYTYKMYHSGAICGIGVAYIGGTRSYINDDSADTIAHELGHNRGWEHAGLDVNDANVVAFNPDPINSIEYGDESCTMGYSGVALRGFSFPLRLQSDWITSSVTDLTSEGCTTLSNILISPLNDYVTGSNLRFGVRALRRNLGRYFVSYRNTVDYDGLAPTDFRGKVTVHYQIFESGTTMSIARLSSGQSWTNANNEFGVVVHSIGTSGATVTINYCKPATYSFVRETISCGSTVTGNNTLYPYVFEKYQGSGVYSIYLQQGTYTFSTCGSSIPTEVTLYTEGGYEFVTRCRFNCGCPNVGTDPEYRGRVVKSVSAEQVGWYILSVDSSPYFGDPGDYTLSVTCQLVGSASSSASKSKSASSSRSNSASRSISRSASPSPSIPPSPSRTATSSRSSTASRSNSASKSVSRSSTASASVTKSPVSSSVSPSPSKSKTSCGTFGQNVKCTANSQCLSCICKNGKCKKPK